jgi:hypothetical protein
MTAPARIKQGIAIRVRESSDVYIFWAIKGMFVIGATNMVATIPKRNDTPTGTPRRRNTAIQIRITAVGLMLEPPFFSL